MKPLDIPANAKAVRVRVESWNGGRVEETDLLEVLTHPSAFDLPTLVILDTPELKQWIRFKVDELNGRN